MEKKKGVLVCSTHWDREWYWPLERFRFLLVRVMDGVIRTLDETPAFHSFTFDGQSIVIEDYLEIRPHMRPALVRLVRSGRLFFGPWYVQPDEFLVSGESLIRNLQRGIGLADSLGGHLPLGYTPDMFGHIPQLPQILRLLGIETALMTRGLAHELDESPVQTEFTWQGLDGSQVRVLFQLRSYGNAVSLGVHPPPSAGECGPADFERARARVEEEIAALSPVSPTGLALLNNGSDHLAMQAELPAIIEHVNRRSDHVAVEHGSYLDYLARVPHDPSRLTLVQGELRGARYCPLLPGVFSARVYLKQENAACETLLCSYVEPLAALAEAARSGSEGMELDGFLEHAWKLLLQNHPHDSICGCSVDQVHDEMETRFAKVAQVARSVRRQALHELGLGLQAGGACDIAVFNPSCWDVPWPVIGLLEEGQRLAGRTFKTPGGELVTPTIRNETEGDPLFESEAAGTDHPVHELSFLHRPVGGCGLNRLTLTGEEKSVPQDGLRGSQGSYARFTDGASGLADAVAENEYLRLTVNPLGNPGMWLLDKRTGRVIGPLNSFHSYADRGDEYDFQPLDGAVASPERPAGLLLLAFEERSGCVVLHVRCQLKLPRGLDESRRAQVSEEVELEVDSVVRVFAGHPVVHVHTEVLNRVNDHKLAALFPLGFRAGRITCGTQFGEVDRPASAEPVVFGCETIPPWYPFREYLVAWEQGAPTAPSSRRSSVAPPPRGEAGHALALALRDGAAPPPRGEAGLALFAKGLLEYGIPSADPDTWLALTLFRAVEWLSRDDLPFRPGHAGPGMHTPGGQCSRLMAFDYGYGVVDSEGRLANGVTYWQAGKLFSAPPVAWPVAPTSGERSDGERFNHSWLRIDSPEIVLSSLRRSPGTGGLAATFYNATGREVSAVLEIGLSFERLTRSNLLGRDFRTDSVTPRPGGAELHFDPFEIVCLRLEGRRGS